MEQDNSKLKKLMEIAKLPVKYSKNEINDFSEVEKFITNYELEPGNEWVPFNVIYYYYKLLKNFKNLQPRNSFGRDLSKHFPNKRSKHGRQFQLNGNVFDQSPEIMNEIAKDLKKENAKKKSKSEKEDIE